MSKIYFITGISGTGKSTTAWAKSIKMEVENIQNSMIFDVTDKSPNEVSELVEK